ncbi:TetR/AcrR family transcriptional regulator [bacterium]|nr:TetR/AcrR family transcriptional regulator [bacterium]
MERVKIDRRIVKTKRAIRAAFANLVAMKDINHITIKELADKADISRKTFYFYYNSVWDIAEEIQNELADKMFAIIDENGLSFSEESYQLVYEKFKSSIENDYQLFISVISASNNPSIREKTIKHFKELLLNRYSNSFIIEDKIANLSIDFIISGSMYVFKKWNNSDKKISLEEFVHVVLLLTRYGLKGLLDKGIIIRK